MQGLPARGRGREILHSTREQGIWPELQAPRMSTVCYGKYSSGMSSGIRGVVAQSTVKHRDRMIQGGYRVDGEHLTTNRRM